MRTRVFTDRSTTDTYEEKLWVVNSITQITTPTALVTSKEFRCMWDVEIPNFYRRRAAGEIFNNPMWLVDYRQTRSAQYVVHIGKFNNNANVTYGEGKVIDLDNPPALFDNTADIDGFLDGIGISSERNVALAQAYSNVDVSEIQALASLGELPETYKWIVSLLYRFKKIIMIFIQRKNLLKLIRGSKGKYLDGFSNLWLEFRYAVRPLVFEMKQAMDALEAFIKLGTRFTARGYHEVEDSSQEQFDFVCSYYTTFDYVRKTSRRSHYRGGILFELELALDETSAIWGLDQPLETVWELTPFSFMIDWFLNIGDILSQWTNSSGLNHLTSWTTEQHLIVQSVLPTSENNWLRRAYTSDQNYVWSSIEQETQATNVTRLLLKRRVPDPSRSLLPGVRVNLDPAKILDIALICRTLMKAFASK